MQLQNYITLKINFTRRIPSHCRFINVIMNVLADQRITPVQETSSCNEQEVMVIVDLRRVHYRITDRESTLIQENCQFASSELV